MTKHVRANTDLGCNHDLSDLVAKIKGFDFDAASTSDHMALARALKVLSDDLIVRHAKAVELEQALVEKLAIAEVTSELAGVYATLRPAPRKRWFG